jgi:hypothetical protein
VARLWGVAVALLTKLANNLLDLTRSMTGWARLQLIETKANSINAVNQRRDEVPILS